MDPWYAAAGGAALACAAVAAAAAWVGPAWDLAQLAGLGALIGCLLLSAAPVRPRRASPPMLLTVARHAWIGWSALALAAVHAAILLLAEPPTRSYLSAAAPAHQLAAIAAMVLLAVLCASAYARGRRRLFADHRVFQALHVGVACTVLGLATMHVVVSGRYAHGLAGRLLFAATAVAATAMLFRARRPGDIGARNEGWAEASAFGRHSRRVAAVAALAATGMLAAVPGRGALALREPLLERPPLLPLSFPHARHTAVNCVRCHHNYVDQRGFDTCLHCHRSARAHIAVGAEARFHDFCLSCHRGAAIEARRGPAGGCVVCHRESRAEQALAGAG
ncbi:MAG: cytochrome c3 family protein [Proteobacteria bacterium]|nr:cytochrome c3 family protein [Pseudomonadota bacterium]